MGMLTSMLIGLGAAAGMALLKKPKIPTPPDVPPLPPTPEIEEEGAKKFARKRRGRAKTILTGELTPVGIGEKTLLGG